LKLETIAWMEFEHKAKTKQGGKTLQDGVKLLTEAFTGVFMKRGLSDRNAAEEL
jgi:hypothetical protein